MLLRHVGQFCRDLAWFRLHVFLSDSIRKAVCSCTLAYFLPVGDVLPVGYHIEQLIDEIFRSCTTIPHGGIVGMRRNIGHTSIEKHFQPIDAILAQFVQRLVFGHQCQNVASESDGLGVAPNGTDASEVKRSNDESDLQRFECDNQPVA